MAIESLDEGGLGMNGIQIQDSPVVRAAVETIQHELQRYLRKPLQLVASYGYETVQIHQSVERYEVFRIVAVVWPDYSGDGPIILKTEQETLDPDLEKHEINSKRLSINLLEQLRSVRKRHSYL